MTVNKLTVPHKSLPANPLIADPLFWTGYVDKVGTGTEDIVNLCKAEGLKTPEYHQEEDFRVVIWRSDPGAIQSDPGAIQSWWRLFTSQFVSILLFLGQNWLEDLRRASVR